MEAIRQGKVSEETVRQRVAPLFYTRMRLGEFDPPAMNPYNKLSNEDVENPAHEKLAVEAAMKSYLLLKNDGLLPLTENLKTIGVSLDILSLFLAFNVLKIICVLLTAVVFLLFLVFLFLRLSCEISLFLYCLVCLSLFHLVL